MRKSELNSIFVERAKKRKKIALYVTSAAILLVLAILCLNLYIGKNKNKYVSYEEHGSVDYKVYLVENDFFKETYLDKDSEYIASLIDYITADFNYNIKLDSNRVNFKYSRDVEAEVVITNLDGKKPLYAYKEKLMDTKDELLTGDGFDISESIRIDYDHFNEIATNFKNSYNLPNASANVIVKMYINVIGDCEDFDNNQSSKAELDLTIPLTTKTMGIDISNNLIANDDNIIVCSSTGIATLFLLLSICLFVGTIVVIVMLSIYIINNRTARDIYEIELKKIMSNYHSFIQKITNDFDYKEYKILKVEEFTELLEIRDTLNQPILMVENKSKTAVSFIIPTTTNLMYMYNLKEKDIKDRMSEK